MKSIRITNSSKTTYIQVLIAFAKLRAQIERNCETRTIDRDIDAIRKPLKPYQPSKHQRKRNEKQKTVEHKLALIDSFT